MAVLVVGCGPSREELEFHAEIAKTMKEYRISEIKAAAIPLFAKYKYTEYGYTNGNDKLIPYDEIPKVISSLPFFVSGEPTNYIIASALDTNTIIFMTGSGFGHWGIIVCKDEQNKRVVKAAKRDGDELTLWGNGVYFYRGN